MSIEKAKAWLAKYGLEDRVLEFEVSSATVELAAAGWAGCVPSVSTRAWLSIWTAGLPQFSPPAAAATAPLR